MRHGFRFKFDVQNQKMMGMVSLSMSRETKHLLANGEGLLEVGNRGSGQGIHLDLAKVFTGGVILLLSVALALDASGAGNTANVDLALLIVDTKPALNN